MRISFKHPPLIFIVSWYKIAGSRRPAQDLRRARGTGTLSWQSSRVVAQKLELVAGQTPRSKVFSLKRQPVQSLNTVAVVGGDVVGRQVIPESRQVLIQALHRLRCAYGIQALVALVYGIWDGKFYGVVLFE